MTATSYAAGAGTADHAALLSGLSPSTTYYYTIYAAAGGLSAGPYSFRSSPAIGTRGTYRLWWLGDPGTGNQNQAAVRDAYLSHNGGVGGTDVLLSVGDNAYELGTDGQFTSNFFAPYAGITSAVAPMPGTGARLVPVGGVRRSVWRRVVVLREWERCQ